MRGKQFQIFDTFGPEFRDIVAGIEAEPLARALQRGPACRQIVDETV